jgi:hypothetical protein
MIRGIKIDRVYEDYCPSTEFAYNKRPGLHGLIEDVMHRRILGVVMENRDRLARVGWEIFPPLFAFYGVETTVAYKGLELPEYIKEQEEDLTLILKKAKIERISDLAPDIYKKPKRHMTKHPGKIDGSWDGEDITAPRVYSVKDDLSDMM